MDTATADPETPLQYAQPYRRGQIYDSASGPAPQDAEPGEPAASTAISMKPLDEIAMLVRALTYGEMMELAAGFWGAKGEDEITQADLPAIIHAWATTQMEAE